MNILVIGGGGREHAICYCLANAKDTDTVYCIPGNTGIADTAVCLDLEWSAKALLPLIREKGIELTVIGPEVPLIAGLADDLRTHGCAVLGPSAAAAQLEGSKTYAKAFMKRHHIPTAEYKPFTDYDAAATYVKNRAYPLVVKASGNAQGKGAVICASAEEALTVLQEMMVQNVFGTAGQEVVIEDFLTGEEASVFALCHGNRYCLLPSAQDHKAVYDGDRGPNTGGMGAYSPAPIVTPSLINTIERNIITPTLTGMTQEGTPYQGILYIGLMINGDNVSVVEYNCRLGDPEAQVVLPLLGGEILPLFYDSARGAITPDRSVTPDGYATCVVLASQGYPGPYKKGVPISITTDTIGRGTIFHAGTATREGQLVTAGGRVINGVGFGDTLTESIDNAYQICDGVDFPGKILRRDIGRKGLARQS